MKTRLPGELTLNKTRFFLYYDKVLAYLRVVFAVTIVLPATLVFSGLALGSILGRQGFHGMAEGLLGNSALVQRQLATPVAAGQIAVCKYTPGKELSNVVPAACPAIEVVSYDKYVALIAKVFRSVYLFLVLLSAVFYWLLFTRKAMFLRWAQPDAWFYSGLTPKINAADARP